MNFTIKSVTPEDFKVRLNSIRRNAMESNFLNLFKKKNDLKESKNLENDEENKETSFMSFLDSLKDPLDEKLNELISLYKEKQDISVLKEVTDHMSNKKQLENDPKNTNSNTPENLLKNKSDKLEPAKIKIDITPEEVKPKETEKSFYVSNLGESLEAAKRNNVGVEAVESVISQTGASEKQKQQINSSVIKGMNGIIESVQKMHKTAETKDKPNPENNANNRLTDFATKPKLPTPFDKK